MRQETMHNTISDTKILNLPENFRDLGGILCTDGRVIARNRLIRSGELTHLSMEDLDGMNDSFQIKNIVDLRTKKECTQSPDCLLPTWHYYEYDFFYNAGNNQTVGDKDMLIHMQREEEIHNRMTDIYASFITEATVREQLCRILELLLDTKEGATLFHCFAGKDRTGITAAVILTCLGVSKDAIMKDYLETNIAREIPNQKILNELRQSGTPKSTLAVIKIAIGVDKRHLKASYETAKKVYGSFDNYITQGIGFTPKQQNLLKELYLTRP